MIFSSQAGKTFLKQRLGLIFQALAIEIIPLPLAQTVSSNSSL